MILELFLFVVLLLSSIVFHELGHLIFIKKYGGKAEINFKLMDFVSEIPDHATKQQTKEIVMVGILAGLPPLFFMMFLLDPVFLIIGGLLYFVGCKHDIRMLRKLDK